MRNRLRTYGLLWTRMYRVECRRKESRQKDWIIFDWYCSLSDKRTKKRGIGIVKSNRL